MRRRRFLNALGVGTVGVVTNVGAAKAITDESPSSPARSTATTSTSWGQQAKLTANDGEAEDTFGTVAVNGDTALIGAVGDDNSDGDFAGSAYVFTRTSGEWTQQAKLTANDSAAHDNFGVAVALSEDTALVGAPGDNNPNGDGAGKAYVFTRTNGEWTQQAKLTVNDGEAHDNFGYSVALDSDTALIRAPYTSEPDQSGEGTSYVFTRSNGKWSQQAKLTANVGGDLNDAYLDSVALDGDTALIGKPSDYDPNGNNSGSAYVFTRTNGEWTQQAKLTADDGDAHDKFGYSVAINGNITLIGAANDNITNGESAGSVYLFTRSNGKWTQQTKLIADDVDPYDKFGYSVALASDTALIGAAFDGNDQNGDDEGSAYVFTRTNGKWTQQAKLTADNGDTNEAFGYSVALAGDTALIGDPADDNTNGANAGSAYVFAPEDEPKGNRPKDPDSDGKYEDVNGDGSVDARDVLEMWNRRSDLDPALFDFTNDGNVDARDALELWNQL